MKKIATLLLTVSGLSHAANALACKVPTSASSATEQMVAQHGGWPISDAKCEFLKKNNLYLSVKTQSTVLSGTSIGFAVVTLVDENNVVSDLSSIYTNADSVQKASMSAASDHAYDSLRSAINDLDFDAAAKQIRAYQKAASRR